MNRSLQVRRFRFSSALSWLGVILLAGNVVATEPPKREVIGEVLGEVVYRDQISKSALQAKDWLAINREMGRLFLTKPMQQYRESVTEDIQPTPLEIERANKFLRHKHAERMTEQEPILRAKIEAIDGQLEDLELDAAERARLQNERTGLQMTLDPPPKSVAVFMLTGWKFQKHVYDKYGGGRTLWQQMGVEAFDATRRLIEDMEKQGKFRVDDPQLRKELYKYWTGQDSSPFIRAQDHKGGNGLQSPLIPVDWDAK